MSSPSRTVLVHIGYPKTATTWLQKNVFDCEALGFRSPFGARAAMAIEQFLLCPYFRFDPVTARDAFAPGLEAAWSSGLVPVISEETLLGNVVRGENWGEAVLPRLRDTFASDDIRVLLTVREQKSLILSSYKEFVLNGGDLSIDDYLWDGAGRPGFRGPMRLDVLDYDVVFAQLQAWFGKDRVAALWLEEVSRGPDAIVGRLSHFAGASGRPGHAVQHERAHVGMGGATLRLRAACNRYCPQVNVRTRRRPMALRLLEKTCRAADRLLPGALHRKCEAVLARRVAELVGDRYAAGNARFASLRQEGLKAAVAAGRLPASAIDNTES